MTETDLPAVLSIQEVAHPGFQERLEVFAERLRLYPEGCLVLAGRSTLSGYIISHPWRLGEPPPLDSLLGELPERWDTYYVHDLALLPEALGAGHGTRVVDRLAEQARKMALRNLSLVAVNHSWTYWRKLGFHVRTTPQLAAKLASYGADAVFMRRDLAPA